MFVMIWWRRKRLLAGWCCIENLSCFTVIVRRINFIAVLHLIEKYIMIKGTLSEFVQYDTKGKA